jgi:hypothetical protein
MRCEWPSEDKGQANLIPIASFRAKARNLPICRHIEKRNCIN